MPSAPVQHEPVSWEHYKLWKRVRDAIYATPDHFSTPTNIEGLLASDIFTLNAPLSATIEESVVSTLNALRTVWDPDGQYQTYSFVRQSQTFPDVVLRTVNNGMQPLMGVELKGWYLLAREAQPTYRFTVTAAACNPWDLLVVVPWALSNVLAGKPVLFKPFVKPAEFCAEQRNHYWQYQRQTSGETGIIMPKGVHPYPVKSDQISDKPKQDGGSNFGRLARYGIMREYMEEMLATRVRGIAVSEWIAFFKQHAQDAAK